MISSVGRVSHGSLSANGGTRGSGGVGFDGDLGLGFGLDEHTAWPKSVWIRVNALILGMHDEARWQRRGSGVEHNVP